MKNPRILVRNTMVLIEDYIANKRIERTLSQWDPNLHKVTFEAYRQIISDVTDMVIPRAYPIKWIKEAFLDHEVKYVKRNLDTRNVPIKCKFEPINKIQEEALDWLFDRENFSQHVLELRTGAGKTYIALKYICEHKKVALIVVHNTNVLEQWIKRITELTDIKEEEIGILQGQKSFDKLEKDFDKKIFITIHRTLQNTIKVNPRRIYDFCKNLDIGIKVIDEAHLEMAETCSLDLHVDIPHNLYLTATAERTDWKENRLYQFILPVYYSWGGGSAKISEEEKYHSIYMIDYTTKTPESVQLEMFTRRGFDLHAWASNTMNYIPQMVEMLEYYLKKFDEKENINCVVLKSLEQCKIFKELLDLQGYEVGMFNSLHEDKKTRSDELKKKIILTTEKSMGTAIDADIDVIFNFLPIASRPATLQLVGRLRNHRKAIFVDFVDNSIEACVAMKDKRSSYLKKIAKRFVTWKYSKVETETKKKFVIKK